MTELSLPAVSASTVPLTWEELLIRLLLSAAYGGCVAAVFHTAYGRRKPDATVMITTLVLLSILVAMVSMVIGESIARAFSLVGALSIVRFRTVVEDTRDTVFVIFAVIVGMAAGAGLILVPMIGIPVVSVAAFLLSRSNPGRPGDQIASESCLNIRLASGRDPEVVLRSVFERHLSAYRLTSLETARQCTALDLKYQVQLQLPRNMLSLVTELNQIEGVLGVELRT